MEDLPSEQYPGADKTTRHVIDNLLRRNRLLRAEGTAVAYKSSRLGGKELASGAGSSITPNFFCLYWIVGKPTASRTDSALDILPYQAPKHKVLVSRAAKLITAVRLVHEDKSLPPADNRRTLAAGVAPVQRASLEGLHEDTKEYYAPKEMPLGVIQGGLSTFRRDDKQVTKPILTLWHPGGTHGSLILGAVQQHIEQGLPINK